VVVTVDDCLLPPLLFMTIIDCPIRRVASESYISHPARGRRASDKSLSDSGIIDDTHAADRERGRRSALPENRDDEWAGARFESNAIHFRIRGERDARCGRDIEGRCVQRSIGYRIRSPIRRCIPVIAGWVEIPRGAASVS